MGDTMDFGVHVVGGGTVDRVRQNLAVASVSYGETARRVAALLHETWPGAQVSLHLTRMASGGESKIETVEDVRQLLKQLVMADTTRAIFLPAALCQFQAAIVENAIPIGGTPDSGTISPRNGQHLMVLTPHDEVVDYVRAYRREIVLVGFATVAGMTDEELMESGVLYAKLHMCSLVVVKDRVERKWAISSPTAGIAVSRDRDQVLYEAVTRARGLCQDVASDPAMPQIQDQPEYAHP